ncbi:MAG TPA: hypothetical protein VGN13_12235 [Solirubrobacteraceae bacterium]|jgi:hypothetical protein
MPDLPEREREALEAAWEQTFEAGWRAAREYAAAETEPQFEIVALPDGERVELTEAEDQRAALEWFLRFTARVGRIDPDDEHGLVLDDERVCFTARPVLAATLEPTDEGRRWRVGRKVGRTIYAQRGERPADDDPLIGVLDTPELASRAVEDHNAREAVVDREPTDEQEREAVTALRTALYPFDGCWSWGVDVQGGDVGRLEKAARCALAKLEAAERELHEARQERDEAVAHRHREVENWDACSGLLRRWREALEAIRDPNTPPSFVETLPDARQVAGVALDHIPDGKLEGAKRLLAALGLGAAEARVRELEEALRNPPGELIEAIADVLETADENTVYYSWPSHAKDAVAALAAFLNLGAALAGVGEPDLFDSTNPRERELEKIVGRLAAALADPDCPHCENGESPPDGELCACVDAAVVRAGEGGAESAICDCGHSADLHGNVAEDGRHVFDGAHTPCAECSCIDFLRAGEGEEKADG